MLKQDLKYKVLGRRVLLRVKKFKKDQTFEGSNLLMPDELLETETTTQTIGEVVGLGELAFLNDDGSQLGGQPAPIKIGDKVHFQRYGAVRLNPKKHVDEEFWIVEDKDLFAIDLIEELIKEKA